NVAASPTEISRKRITTPQPLIPLTLSSQERESHITESSIGNNTPESDECGEKATLTISDFATNVIELLNKIRYGSSITAFSLV
ncbi:MAG TPA: hypothetical protein VFX37_07015, partial [Pseudolabrys sp.]|nr:hypothetical protein [Pseudolabrys sp.]